MVIKNLTKKSEYTLAELVEGLDVTIKGNPDCIIRGVCPIESAQADRITFLNTFLTKRYRQYLPETQAAAVILTQDDADDCPVNAVISANPYFTYAQIAGHFREQMMSAPGIHATAIIEEGAQVDSTASIGAYAVVGRHTTIGAHAVIGSHCVIGDNVVIGDETVLDAHAVIYQGVFIGKRSKIASGAVIGGEGFGYANHKGQWFNVPQLGTVEIGDDVDVGVNTSIDRGALGNTVIGNGVKLDNQIQVGHNVKIGEHTIVAGCVGIAGSAEIGKYCMIGGGSLINGHISICDKAVIAGSTGVESSITEPGMYASGVIGALPFKEFRRSNARFHRLESMSERIKALESALKALSERN